ncbi:MAG: hypothetical protein JO141_07450 [Bradyrhizobium sp.]|nr:hypothetical protein [Bradyrhizobium sp.]
MGMALEATLIRGRRAGKSLVLALIAAYVAAFRDWSPHLVGGERATIIVVAADKKQAGAIFKYLKAFLSIPLLSGLITRETRESIDLSNNVTVEILTADFRTIRSRTVVAALIDEEAFWPIGEGLANPDVEIVNAIRPAMATIPGAMLLKASSPYARRGDLYEDFRRYYGKDDASALVWKADTKSMNPTVSDAFLAKEYERDPAHAAAEYGAEFRSDIESFISREAVEACIVPGRFELPPVTGIEYTAFADSSGGSADSMTLSITHRDGDKVIVGGPREQAPIFAGSLRFRPCRTAEKLPRHQSLRRFLRRPLAARAVPAARHQLRAGFKAEVRFVPRPFAPDKWRPHRAFGSPEIHQPALRTRTQDCPQRPGQYRSSA